MTGNNYLGKKKTFLMKGMLVKQKKNACGKPEGGAWGPQNKQKCYQSYPPAPL